MRHTYSFNENWMFSETGEEHRYEDTEVTLPFIHYNSDMPECIFSNTWKAEEKDEGQNIYLCFAQVSGDIEIYDGENLAGSHKGSPAPFNILLAENVKAGRVFDIKIKITPAPRTDAKFVFGKAGIVTVSSSHFDMEEQGCVRIHTVTSRDGADVQVAAKIVKPNNYDVVSFSVVDHTGETIITKTAKPTEAATVIKIGIPGLWDGQSGACLYTLRAVLQRDSTVLDEVDTVFGIKDIKLSDDGFLYLSNVKLPLSGVCLTDCSRLKTDLENFKLLDGNCLAASAFPTKTNLLTACDNDGNLFWYEYPYKENDDFTALREFLLSAAHHPSFTFVQCSDKADSEYREKFHNVCRKCAPDIFTAATCDINATADFEPGDFDIIAIKVPFTDKAEAYLGIGARFNEIADKYPEKHFAVIAAAPAIEDADDSQTDFWSIRLWDTFCREKRVILYLADTFTDSKEPFGKRGIMKGDRNTFCDRFWFYKTQFSAQGFIKISPSDVVPTDARSKDIRCFTNLDDLRLLVNGKDKKYTAEKLSDGVYVYRNIKLKKGENLLEVSAGDECDNATIIRN